MAHVEIARDAIEIRMTLEDGALNFQGSFAIALAHITAAFVSDIESLELQQRPSDSKGRFSFGASKTAGVYANRDLVVFAGAGESDYLVIETLGERYKQIAVQLDDDADPNDVARRIMAALPGAEAG